MAQAGLKTLGSNDLPASTSLSAEITGMHHCTLLGSAGRRTQPCAC